MSLLKSKLLARIARILLVVSIALAAVTTVSPRQIYAQATSIVKMESRIEIHHNGDASVHEQYTFPVQTYSLIKSKFDNANALVRAIQSGSSWVQLDELTGEFDEANSRVAAEYIQRGYVRTPKEGLWELALPKDADLDLIAVHDNVAILSTAMEMEFGTTNYILRITLPEGAKEVALDKQKRIFSYRFVPNAEAGEKTEASFELESKEHMMSGLGKLYGNADFTAFWAARSMFKNEGELPLSNFRVRFRVVDHSSWSDWKRTKVVYPHQTVIDPFFPVLDLDKLASLTGSRPVMIEAEYEYDLPDGTTVRDSDARQLQLTSRNQVVFSSRRDNDVLTWREGNDLSPYVIAAFTNSEDPVMQQIAGGVCRMLNGVDVTANDEQAAAFVLAFWKFLEMNRVSYQAPPGFSINGRLGQNIKYGRDVIRNRAGTCVDLAILWASVGKAAGLETGIVVIPGHAFPIIKLPSGTILSIESTMIGSGTVQEAAKKGDEMLAKAKNGDSIIVEIDEYQNQGVRGLDLPNVESDYLKKLGYTFEVPAAAPQTQPAPNNQAKPAAPARTNNAPANNGTAAPAPRTAPTNATPRPTPAPNANPAPAKNLATMVTGAWRTSVTDATEGAEAVFIFAPDGKYGFRMEVYEANQPGSQPIRTVEAFGTWSVSGNELTIQTETATIVHKPTFKNGAMFIPMDGGMLELRKVD